MFAAFLAHLTTPATITYLSDETDGYGNPLPGTTVTWMCWMSKRTIPGGVTADGVLHRTVQVVELTGDVLVPEPRPGDQVRLPGQVARTLTADDIETVPGFAGPHHLVIKIGN